ncbi:hypothetical protein B296_00005933 [Ensete ventricosum]|uniref:Transposase (putative) gypsy type domain-containing protein n=1 Tax=Ensete ventricosum TaxID=4639 RepID=A0A427B5N2_ENSVE|nr:hypothetical protein B296_00005933 [Ensete ventricosum]
MTSSDSSNSVRVISSPGSGGVSLGDPEASPSRAPSGSPSLVDARALRDLEVMKADHDLDTAVTEGSLATIRERYSIPTEYGLHVPQPGQRPYSLSAPDICVSMDALEAGPHFSLHPLIEECLRWWRISPTQVAPNSWRYLVVFLGECRGAGIIPTRDLFMTYFRLYNSRDDYYLTARVGFRVSGAPSNNKGWKSCYFFVSDPVWGFRLDWSAHPIGNAPPYLFDEEFILVGRLKGILSSSCVIKKMTGLWLVKAGLGPASRDRMDLGDLHGTPTMSGGKASSVRTTAPAREIGVSPAMEAPKASSKRPIDASIEQVDDPARRPKKVKVLIRRHNSWHGEGGSHSHSKGKEPIAPAEEPESLVESDEGDASPELGKTKQERDEALQRLEASEKELTEVRSDLAKIQRLLKEARDRARKMDDELLQSVKVLESAQAELPKQAVNRYKESAGFKEGLK